MERWMRVSLWGGVAAMVAGSVMGGVMMLSPSGTAATTPQGVRECRQPDLTAKYKQTDAATSHRFGWLKLKNVSQHKCWIRGYGGLSYVGQGNGTQIGAPADRTPSRKPLTVLSPGDKARSEVSETVADAYPKSTCRPAKVDGFRVYPPDETRSLFVPHVTVGCRNPAVHLLEHKAYRPGGHPNR